MKKSIIIIAYVNIGNSIKIKHVTCGRDHRTNIN